MSEKDQKLMQLLAQNQAMVLQQLQQQQHYQILNYMQGYAQHQGWQYQQNQMPLIQPRFFIQTSQSGQIFAPVLFQSIQSKHPYEVDPSFQTYVSNHAHENQILVLNQLPTNDEQAIRSSSEFMNIKVESVEALLEQKNFSSQQVPQQNLQKQATSVQEYEIMTEKDIPTPLVSKTNLSNKQEECDILSNSKQKNSSDQSDSSYSASIHIKKPKIEDLGIKQTKNTGIFHKNIKKISKNIPKNIFKGIIKYIIGKKEDIQRYFEKDQDEVNQYIHHIKRSRNLVLSMQQIKTFLHSKENEKYSKLSRIFSYQFIDKHYIAYIYNSKIKCRREHLANRQKFMNIICNAVNQLNNN